VATGIAALIRAGDPQEAIRPYVDRMVVGSVDDERIAEEALNGTDALMLWSTAPRFRPDPGSPSTG
jgi:hypothetical protein